MSKKLLRESEKGFRSFFAGHQAENPPASKLASASWLFADSRISRDCHPAFMLLSGRVIKPRILLQASLHRLPALVTLVSYIKNL